MILPNAEEPAPPHPKYWSALVVAPHELHSLLDTNIVVVAVTCSQPTCKTSSKMACDFHPVSIVHLMGSRRRRRRRQRQPKSESRKRGAEKRREKGASTCRCKCTHPIQRTNMPSCDTLLDTPVSAQHPASRAALPRLFRKKEENARLKVTQSTAGKTVLKCLARRSSPTGKQFTDIRPNFSILSLEAGSCALPENLIKRRRKHYIFQTSSNNQTLWWSRPSLSYCWLLISCINLQTAYLAQEASSTDILRLRSSCRLSPPQVTEKGNLISILSSSRNGIISFPWYQYTLMTNTDWCMRPLRKWEEECLLPSLPLDTARWRPSKGCRLPRTETKESAEGHHFRDMNYLMPRMLYRKNLTKCRGTIAKKETVSFLVFPPTANVLQQMTEKLSESRGRLLIPRQMRVRAAVPEAARPEAAATNGDKEALQTAQAIEAKNNDTVAREFVPLPDGIRERFPFLYGADAFDFARRSRLRAPANGLGGKKRLLGDNRRKPFIYFDNAATVQKPWEVLQELQRAYIDENANVHRSTYSRAAAATGRLESVRSQLAKYLNAEHADEIVFTSGATDSINLVAGSWGDANISEGDEIVLSVAEHHSNIVPWQLLAKRKRASLRYIQLDEHLLLSVPSLLSSLSPRTKLVALSHTSNVLGSFNPYVREIIAIIKRYNPSIVVLLDSSQALAHHKVDVRELMCDFLVGSGHKMYGPTGVGILYGKRSLLQEMPPWKGGGEMIAQVHRNSSTYADPPGRFEAGTPPFVQIAGLGAALDFIEQTGFEEVAAYETKLHNILRSALEAQVPSLRLFCPPAFPSPPPHFSDKVSSGESLNRLEPLPPVPLISFAHPSIHAQDIATFLDVCDEIYVRSGHHCCQLLHGEVLRVPATCRASLALYNTEEEVDRFVKSLRSILTTLERESSMEDTHHAAPETDQLLASEIVLPQEETVSLHSEHETF